MFKRVAALLMCTVMIFSSVPVSPFAEYLNFTVEASAAQQELARVEISPSSLTVYENRTGELTATAYDADGEEITQGITYTWVSDNDSVATVNEDGVVTGVSSQVSGGVALISVIAQDGAGNTKTAYRAVIVKSFVPITSLKPVEPLSRELTALETTELKVIVAPYTASETNLKWTSSDTSIAEVYQTGYDATTSTSYARISAKAEGTVKIRYEAADGTGKWGEFTVKVNPLVSKLTLPTALVLTMESKNVRVIPVIEPSNAGNPYLEWSTDAESVCKVSTQGYLTPVSTGVCFITAKTTDGSNLVKKTKVIVSDGTVSVVLDKSDLSMKVGDPSIKLNATCTTPTLEYKDAVTWVSSDTSVVQVSSAGSVTAVGPGTAKITASAIDNRAVFAECTVSVTQPVTGVKLPATAVCWKGETINLKAEVLPSNASNKNITWSVDNPEIAEITQEGVVTGKSVGKTKITVTTEDGRFTAECEVSVEIPPESVTVAPSSVTLKVGDGSNASRVLSATVNPIEATNKIVEWSSSNPDVARVDATGKVVAVAGGVAVITATTQSAGKTASCTVTVLEDESGVKITNAPTSIYVSQQYVLGASVSPVTATNKDVTWTSSDAGVLRVDPVTGTLVGIAAGVAVVTVRTNNKGLTDTCTVTVTDKMPVSSITLNKTSATILNGSELILSATVKPDNASDKSVRWSSSNTSVAAVSPTGVVYAYKAGVTVIKATTADGGYEAVCYVTVTEPVTGVKLNHSTASIAVGNALAVTATVSPSNASNKKVTWTSSNTSVATVNASGVVTGKAAGTSVIVATTSDGGYTAQCTVTVVVPVTGIKFNATSLTVPKGETRTVTTTISPWNATNKNVIWKTSDSTIATVSSTGLIKGVRAGIVEISATTKDGSHVAVLDVKVIQPASSVTLNFTSLSMDVGKKKTLTPTLKPLTVTDKTVKWKSSNTAVATVSDTGEIKGVSAGTATITCTSGDGYASTTCKVTITQSPTGIKFASSTATARIGTPLTLTPTLSPSTVTNKNLVWSSSDSSIATVSNGVVTGIKKGTVKITARTANNLSAVVTVKVVQPVTGLSLNKTSLTLAVGKSTTIKAIIKPSTASNKNVTWTSSDNDVLTVSSSGKITSKSQGYAVVTCTTKDGNKKATCSVFVKIPVKSVTLNKTSVRLDVNEKLTLKATVKPSNVSNPSLKWKSDDTRVAKVSSSGVVTPVSPGIAIISVTSIDGGYKDTCKIIVARKVKSVTIPSELTVYIGEKKKLSAKITPSNATVKTVSWKTSKKSVATVSSKGTISPKKKGTATITVTSNDGKKKDTCKVTVRTVIKSLKLKKTKITLNTGGTYTLKVTKKPSSATELIKWTSADTKIAKVSSSGVVTATGRGTVKITGKTDHGKKVVCTVTVNQPVTGMNIQKTADVYLGEAVTLKANVLPTNANNKSFTWVSSDTSVATVSNGKITPKKLGKTTITVKSTNGKTASCVVTVKQHVNSVALNKYNLSLNIGNTFALTATVNPATASDKGYTFTSSDSSVVAVSADGIITARKPGKATVTVKTKENNKSAFCTVTVIQPASSVKLSSTAAEVYAGSKVTLTGTVSPADTTDKKLTWTSSNAGIATVSNGVVTGKKAGTVTITAKTHNGKTASCVVTVKQHVTSVTLGKAEVDIIKGQTYTLDVTVNPSDATEKGYICSTSDTSVATVNEDGVITAHKAGTATITVRSKENNKTATCKVNVIEKVESITVSPTVETLYVGETLNILCTVLPETATDKSVKWTSADETVASVDENGVVTALKSGTADIIATTVDGGLTAECKLTVFQKATGITLEEKIVINRGSTQQINANVLPSDAYNKNVTWDIAHPEIATVNQYGVVEGISTGTTVITATSVDGGYKASCIVYVNEPVTGVSLDRNDIERLYMGQTETLTATVYPTEYKGENMNRELIWSSSDENVLTVIDGVITPVGKGNATVTVKTADGGYEDTCTVRCLVPVESVSTDKDVYYIYLGEQATVNAAALPENADYPELKWEILGGEEFFTLDEGVITSKAKGTGVVRITSIDNPAVTKTVEIHIVKKVEGISLNVSSMTLNKGDTYSLVATVTPADAHDTSVSFTSDNEAVATVDGNGLVSAVGRGTARITATTTDGSFTAFCDFTVNQLVEEITFPEAEYTVGKGKRITLNATVLPEDATDKTLIWSSDDNSKVTVNDGVVYGVEKGEAIITAKSADSGDAEKTVKITVVQHAEEITVEGDGNEMAVGDTMTLKAVVSPDDTTDKTVTWTSGDEAVATVDENGVVTAVSADSQTGISTVIITATSACKCAEGTYEITVKQKVDDIVVDQELLMEKGDTLTAEYEVLPANAYDKSLTWTSDNEEVVSVTDGVISALATGEAEITVTAADTGKVAKKIKVTVVQYAEAIDIVGEKNELYIGESVTLDAVVSPDDTTDKTVTWTTSDESVAVVDENGKVIAVGADSQTGISTVTITATSKCNRAVATYDITVKQQATIIRMAEENPVIELGKTYTVSAEVLPANTYDKTLTFTSGNEEVAKVDENGVITAVGIGTAEIRAVSACGKAEAMCTVKVIVLPESITMEEEIRLEKNSSYQMNPVLTPDNVTETDIFWSSSDESVASVCEMGLVTAHKTGEVTITAKTEKEEVFAECKVTVFVNSESVSLDRDELTFFVGDEITLEAAVLPEDTSDKTVIWTSSDENVVAVDSEGKITAVNSGTAEIKAVTKDTGKEDICIVNVRKHAEAIYFDNDEMSAYIGRRIKLDVSFEPADTTEKELIWSVSDERIATVDNEGNLTPLKEGSVILIAESVDCGYKAVCFIDVKVGTEKVTLDKKSVLMNQNSTEKLTFTLEPSDVTDKKVIWTSSDESVASVRNGIVSSKAKAGQTVIRATSVDNPAAYDECVVTVKQHLRAIYLEENSFEMRTGDTASLKVIFDPVDATDKRVRFESADSSIASVDADGKITAVSAGVTTVKAVSLEGEFEAVCNIRVLREIESITAEDFTLRCLEIEPANIVINPAINDEELISTSTNENIARLDSNGNIVAGNEPGEVTITVTGSISGKSTSFRVTVIQPVSSVRFTRESIEVGVGEYTAVPFEVLPANATNKNVHFISSDETVAIIDSQSDGTIYTLKAGKATITVITEDGELRASYEVTVTE